MVSIGELRTRDGPGRARRKVGKVVALVRGLGRLHRLRCAVPLTSTDAVKMLEAHDATR